MFIKNITYFVATCLVLQLVVAFVASEDRIVGGYRVNISEVPYIVKVRQDTIFTCGGTLITTTHVVSAAHCYEGVAPTALLVIGGATYLNESGVGRKVTSIKIPGNYDPATNNHDVAVLKLSAPMIGPNITPIGMFTGDITPGMILQVSGWGATGEDGSVSNALRTIKIPIISRDYCQIQYAWEKITQQMLCASDPGVKDSCQGDSGGPAVCNGKLCGIVSWGYGCARSDYPGVYTNITSVRKYIIDNMV